MLEQPFVALESTRHPRRKVVAVHVDVLKLARELACLSRRDNDLLRSAGSLAGAAPRALRAHAITLLPSDFSLQHHANHGAGSAPPPRQPVSRPGATRAERCEVEKPLGAETDPLRCMVASFSRSTSSRAAGGQPPASDRSPPGPADDEAALFAELGQIFVRGLFEANADQGPEETITTASGASSGWLGRKGFTGRRSRIHPDRCPRSLCCGFAWSETWLARVSATRLAGGKAGSTSAPPPIS